MTINSHGPSADHCGNAEVTLLTKSFAGDFELCRMLCESVDRFAPQEFVHHVVVPKADIPLFSQLATSRRIIIAEDAVLPKWLYKLPMPSARWRKRLRLPRRDVYMTPYGRPVRGWIAQQIMKLEAARKAPTEIVVHLDSDIVLIRPFTRDCFLPAQDRVRLYKKQDDAPLETHIVWRRVARTLLGLPEPQPQADIFYDYIGHVVVWRRSVVQKMMKHMETVNQNDWRLILANTPHFSEYIIYGIFADEVMGADNAGLVFQNSDLCHTRWSAAFRDTADEDCFRKALSADAIAFCLQSTLPISVEDRRRLLDRMLDQAHLADQQHTPSPALIANDARSSER